MAVRAFSRVMALVMEDIPNEDSIPCLANVAECDNTDSTDPLGSQHYLEKKGGMEKHIKNVNRNQDWLNAASKKLSISIKLLRTVCTHPQINVRIELASSVALILSKCTKSMGENVSELIDLIITLSEDDAETVRHLATDCLTETNRRMTVNCEMRSVAELVEENFYKLLTQLPRIMKQIDQSSQLYHLSQLTGYLKLLGNARLPKVMSSVAHLRRLLLVLIYIVELDCRDVSVLTENHFESLKNTTVLESNSWKKFKFIHNPAIQDKIMLICKLLGDLGDKYILVHSIFELIIDMPHYRNELILILNWTCMKPNTVQLSLYEQIIDHYIDSELWYLPIHVQDDISLRKVQSNIIQMCLLTEGLGLFASALQHDYQRFLLMTLYLIIERAGSQNRLINTVGYCALEEYARSQSYSDIATFLSNNMDYILYHVTVKIRKIEKDVGVFDVLTIIIKHSCLKTLPCFESIIEDTVNKLNSNFHNSDAYSLLKVLYTFVVYVRENVSKRTNQNTTEEVEPVESASASDSVVRSLLLSCEAKAFAQIDDNSATSDDDDLEEELSKKSPNLVDCSLEQESAENSSLHVRLIEQIMKCSIHFVPSKNTQTTLIAMQILKEGLGVLAPWTDQLLPIVHQLWHPLVGRFKEMNILIKNYAWQLFYAVVQVSEDFVRSRTINDISWAIGEFLQFSLEQSYLKDVKNPYKFTQMFKLQKIILCQLGSVARHLRLHERQLWQLLGMTEKFLHHHQHPLLREYCIDLYKTVYCFNADVVWVKCLCMWNSHVRTIPIDATFEINDLNTECQPDGHQNPYQKSIQILLDYINQKNASAVN